MTASPTPKRRGRPLGAITLTPEIQAKIVAYIRAGAFDHAAAEAAGVPIRTFYEWIARGENRHATRGSTPQLVAFAREVAKAKAEARITAEATVHQQRPSHWLAYAARTKDGREGWSDPGKSKSGGDSALQRFSDQQIQAELQACVTELFILGVVESPPCRHSRCRCPHHKRGTYA